MTNVEPPQTNVLSTTVGFTTKLKGFDLQVL